ncbi:MAG: AraC family transcriptional regulator [Bacteroidota bacterium]
MLQLTDYLNNHHGRVDTSSASVFEGQCVSRGVALKVVTKGVEQYEIANRAYRPKPGQLLLMDEGMHFGAFVYEQEPQEGMCIDIPRKTLFAAAGDWESGPQALAIPWGLIAYQHDPIGPFLDQFRAEIQHLDWEAQGYEYLYHLAEHLLPFLRQLRGEQLRLQSKKPSTQHELFQRLQLAKAFLHDHVKQPFSLEAVAQASALSPFHLSRLFRRCFGTTLFVYHEALKLHLAHQFLSQRDWSVSEVANELGYDDPGYFIKRFKKHWGTTPGKLARCSHR